MDFANTPIYGLSNILLIPNYLLITAETNAQFIPNYQVYRR